MEAIAFVLKAVTLYYSVTEHVTQYVMYLNVIMMKETANVCQDVMSTWSIMMSVTKNVSYLNVITMEMTVTCTVQNGARKKL
jgi:hypothetical protein